MKSELSKFLRKLGYSVTANNTTKNTEIPTPKSMKGSSDV